MSPILILEGGKETKNTFDEDLYLALLWLLHLAGGHVVLPTGREIALTCGDREVTIKPTEDGKTAVIYFEPRKGKIQ